MNRIALNSNFWWWRSQLTSRECRMRVCMWMD